jgi:hypothetical protein
MGGHANVVVATPLLGAIQGFRPDNTVLAIAAHKENQQSKVNLFRSE